MAITVRVKMLLVLPALKFIAAHCDLWMYIKTYVLISNKPIPFWKVHLSS